MTEDWPGPCPKCGGKVYDDAACPSYISNGRRVVCMPPCGNAWEFLCIGDVSDDDGEGCGWRYTWGLGKSSERFASNEEDRPAWLVGDFDP